MAAAGNSEHMKAAEARDSLAISRNARPTPLTGSAAQGTSCIGKGTALACKSSKKAEKDVHRRNRALEKLCAKGQREAAQGSLQTLSKGSRASSRQNGDQPLEFQGEPIPACRLHSQDLPPGELDSKFPLQSTKCLSTLQASGVSFQICLRLQELKNKPLRGLKQHSHPMRQDYTQWRHQCLSFQSVCN